MKQRKSKTPPKRGTTIPTTNKGGVTKQNAARSSSPLRVCIYLSSFFVTDGKLSWQDVWMVVVVGDLITPLFLSSIDVDVKGHSTHLLLRITVYYCPNNPVRLN